MTVQKQIKGGATCLGLELGSTRIKAILIDQEHRPIAAGSHSWENHNVNGIWTYPLNEVYAGIQGAYADLKQDVQRQYDCSLKKLRALGISAMMHGYLVFDRADRQLVEFRTWRNSSAREAAAKLSKALQFNIPARWSIAHLYQAVLTNEAHVKDISFITTLAGYVHWQLTGRRVLGIGDASGIFPIDHRHKTFDQRMLKIFNNILAGQHAELNLELGSILPEILVAGQAGGTLTSTGAQLLDPSGELEAGTALCPPEGDAGTGMLATNSIAPRTGNVSAGTSVFAMLVLEKPLSKMHSEIDLVSTPAGLAVAMVHTNNCTSDYDAWLLLLAEAAQLLGAKFSKDELYATLLPKALEGELDCGGLLSYGYIAGEHISGLAKGAPLFLRSATDKLSLANFLRCHLYSSLATLRLGLDILLEEESVEIDELRGHGGFFKSTELGQRIMAAATAIPVTVLETAAEGGAWGMALLASYMVNGATTELEAFLASIFAAKMQTPITASPNELAGFRKFLASYKRGLQLERLAASTMFKD